MSQTNLETQQCEACHIDAPQVEDGLKNEYLATLVGWSVVSVEGVDQLQKSYSFKNFRTALAFTNAVGALAEAEGHHPDILTSWGKVTVTWWTHSINALHKNDFICAAKTDAINTD